ncbi:MULTISPECIES: 5'-3' exonuclease [unclassified Cryobacterium]|uniref:5'-3' exonuclease n=1 Tax=unclassified Cryobacterium TaxID=2649013 RepID=UPI002B22CED0|nr:MULTISPECIES: 5'-3' exonuclease [unclassified Cryobacterium]MEA9999505.1 5'-3' exonuclease [Cryobacterium sp. RTS3]MEB0267202.1 5'-3' exonuclease [Cryobacterium sp. 10I5]
MLLDTAALYFRAFYGVPDTVRAPNGQPVNAVRGLLDIITRLVTEFPPTEIVACWDDDWRPQWRVDLIPTYKTHRVTALVESPAADAPTATEDVPELLSSQVPIIRELLAALGIPVIGSPRHEADDVIGTLASHADIPVDVVTGDRDLFQLVDDSRTVRVIYTGRGMARLETLTDAALSAKTGVSPAQYADFAALRGDASDGLPGVAGIGEKTAATLLADFGDLDGIVAAAVDPASAMAAGVRAKIRAAVDYLAVAPTVVNVVRDLSLPAFDARIRPSAPEQDAELERLSAEWGFTTSMKRARAALLGLA